MARKFEPTYEGPVDEGDIVDEAVTGADDDDVALYPDRSGV